MRIVTFLNEKKKNWASRDTTIRYIFVLYLLALSGCLIFLRMGKRSLYYIIVKEKGHALIQLLEGLDFDI